MNHDEIIMNHRIHHSALQIIYAIVKIRRVYILVVNFCSNLFKNTLSSYTNRFGTTSFFSLYSIKTSTTFSSQTLFFRRFPSSVPVFKSFVQLSSHILRETSATSTHGPLIQFAQHDVINTLRSSMSGNHVFIVLLMILI